jgi:hypothetical protein
MQLRPSISPRMCLSTEGRIFDDGESWYDGCRHCYCHVGQEMCALITCPAVNCINPIIRVGDCCPSCPGKASMHSKDRPLFGGAILWVLALIRAPLIVYQLRKYFLTQPSEWIFLSTLDTAYQITIGSLITWSYF